MEDDDAACEIETKIETINQLFEIKVNHLRSLRNITTEFSVNTSDIEDDILTMETQIVKLVAELVILQERVSSKDLIFHSLFYFFSDITNPGYVLFFDAFSDSPKCIA